MKFTEIEIEKAKELKKLKILDRLRAEFPKAGQYFFAREAPEGSVEVAAGIFLITRSLTLSQSQTESNAESRIGSAVWLPTLDELLEVLPTLQISFSQVTDFIHRRRFADGREREGVYQLFIERLRSSFDEPRPKGSRS